MKVCAPLDGDEAVTGGELLFQETLEVARRTDALERCGQFCDHLWVDSGLHGERAELLQAIAQTQFA